jgi:hypothetical protein
MGGRKLHLLLIPLLAIACASERDPGPMRAAVEPRLEAFAEYDRWARRLGLADSAFRSDEALAEAAFAPLRERSDVAAAWLHREGPDAQTLAYPDGAPAPPESGWVPVRTDALGEVEGQHFTLRSGERERRCVLIRRSAPAPGDAVLHVTVAFPEDAPP